MFGAIVTDQTDDNFLAVNLLDILRLLEALADNSEWDISGLECFGDAAEELQNFADTKVRVPGKVLLRLAANVTQVIDGVFTGYSNGADKPWIIIRAVDSFAYEVSSENEDVLRLIRQKFKNVSRFLVPRLRPGNEVG